MRPFEIVTDEPLHCLLKTGRPDYKLPSAATVARDVKKTFKVTRMRLAKRLRVSTITAIIGEMG